MSNHERSLCHTYRARRQVTRCINNDATVRPRRATCVRGLVPEFAQMLGALVQGTQLTQQRKRKDNKTPQAGAVICLCVWHVADRPCRFMELGDPFTRADTQIKDQLYITRVKQLATDDTRTDGVVALPPSACSHVLASLSCASRPFAVRGQAP